MLIIEKHSIAMVTDNKYSETVDLQLFWFVIDFLMYNSGLTNNLSFLWKIKGFFY